MFGKVENEEEMQMEELKKLVENLITLDGGDEKKNNIIVNELQEIGKKLITEYELKIGDVTVDPLWVEAYYYNADKGFTDPFVHRREMQLNKSAEDFGKLYFHHNTDDQRSGVDIRLALSDNYYLSFLLKYTLLNGEFTTQAELSKKIRDSYEKVGCMLIRKEENNKNCEIIGCTGRIGLSAKDADETKAEEKAKYKPYKLAIAKDFDKIYNKPRRLPQIEKLTKSYLATYEGDKDKGEKCHEILGYCLKEYEGK